MTMKYFDENKPLEFDKVPHSSIIRRGEHYYRKWVGKDKKEVKLTPEQKAFSDRKRKIEIRNEKKALMEKIGD